MDEIVVIRLTPYQESNVIMQGFTRQCGLVRVFTSIRAKIEVMSHAKVSLWQKGHGFFYLRESSLIDPYLALRSDFEKLRAASLMLRVIDKSQIETRRSHELFDLLTSYLDTLKIFTNAKALSYSFAMKVLEFEGLIDCDASAKKESIIKNLVEAKKFEDLLELDINEPQEKRLKAHIEEALRALT